MKKVPKNNPLKTFNDNKEAAIKKMDDVIKKPPGIGSIYNTFRKLYKVNSITKKVAKITKPATKITKKK
jgi:hypothetical protein